MMGSLSKQRAHWIGAPQFFELNQACRVIADAYDHGVYLVGSSLTTRDYRDVDVRCILADEEFGHLFPGVGSNAWLNARWSLLCSSLSLWLRERTGLPVDFQFQQRTRANAEHPGPGGRIALGLWVKDA